MWLQDLYAGAWYDLMDNTVITCRNVKYPYKFAGDLEFIATKRRR
jgi:hypothetical protein